MQKLLKRDFIKWLNKFDKDDYIGKQKDACHCPIAKFLTAKKYIGVCVGKRYWDRDSGNGSFIETTLPKWAINFIKKIDKIKSMSGVTKEDCLEALK